MRVIKPQNLGILTRPFEFRGKVYCGVAILAFLPLGGRRMLLSETGMWPLISEVLGEEGVLDVAIPKKRGEYLVAGNAWPVADSDRTKSRIRVRLGELEKTLNVFGDRYFQGDRISEPLPFEAVSLGWESVFGGEGFKHNPHGKGFKPIKDQAGRKVHPLPNIEYPHDMMGLPGQQPKPAGFGPVDGMWSERYRKVGTYDQAWLERDYPGFAKDIDWSYFNIASSDQQTNGVFRGDESYLLQGMHPDRPRIEGQLPGFMARCFVCRTGQDTLEELSCNLTTIWFFPDREHAVMVFHASTEIEQPDGRDVAQIMIAADDIASPRPVSHYAQVLSRRLDEEKGSFEMLRDEDLVPAGLERGGGLDPDEALKGQSESIRGQYLRERMEEDLAKGQGKLEEGMKEIDAELPPEPEMPDLGFDPKELHKLRMADLPELVDRLEALAESSRMEQEAKGEESWQKFDKDMASLQEGFPDKEFPDSKIGVGPPTFKASEKQAEARDKINEMKSLGTDTSELEAALLGEDMAALYNFSEEGLVHMYRMGANNQNPAPRAAEQSDLGSRLRAAIEAGQSVDAQDYTGANLSGMNLAGADLSGIFLESADLSQANLVGAQLDNAVLAHADLSGARLDKASLQKANLGKARLVGASAEGADFREAILTEADLTGAVMDSALLTDADLRDVRFKETSMAGVSLDDFLLMDTSIRGLNFAGASLEKAIFVDVDAGEVNFSGARMREAAFLKSRANGANFSNADLQNFRIVLNSDFSGSNFSGANLVEACLRESRIMGCEFQGANLVKADLSGIQGGGSNMRRVVANGCQFILADLRDADLTGANLMGVSMERADLRGAKLTGANMFQLDLARAHVDKGTDFEGALTKKMRTYPRKFPARRSS